MNVLYITSQRPGAGKSAAAMAILSALAERGRRVGYFKPFANGPGPDGDVDFARQVAAWGEAGLVVEPLSPRPDASSPSAVARAVEGVKVAVAAAPRCDVLILEGPSLRDDESDLSALSLRIVEELNARVLLMAAYSPGMGLEGLSRDAGAFGHRLLGVVLNMVTRHRLREAEELARRPEAADAGLLGVVPEDRLMLSVTLGQAAEGLDGRWVMGREGAGRLVERFLIGGNLMDSGNAYFGRKEATVVIVRGDRPDIQLAALASPLHGLIITGGHRPTEYLYHEVERLNVPLVVAPGRTDAAVDALALALDAANGRHPAKVARFRELLATRCGLEEALEQLA